MERKLSVSTKNTLAPLRRVGMEMVKSLYIHIPFCRKKCPYCDFYSVSYQKDIAASYVETLSRKIKELDHNFTTIYLGGGTPTVLEVSFLKKLLKSLRKVFNKGVEFTVECNPESLDKEKIKLFFEKGVNRLSLGVQSFYEDKLKKLGRIHSAGEAYNAISIAEKEGFKNISIDLIFGVEGESLPAFRKELDEAVNLPITHISIYSLTYEKNTPLFKEVEGGRLIPLDEDIVARMYEFAVDYLPSKGFFQYEVSNFSKKGYRCRHNLNYWENNPYLGLGPSAVSYVGGLRERNISCVKRYIKKINQGESPVTFKERLLPLKKAKETAALKIRTKQGVDFKSFKKKCGFDFLELEGETLRELIKTGLIKYHIEKNKRTGVYLTRKGFLFCDTVSAAFL